MRCLECGLEAVTERPERTAQGYRRFRCRACGKQFNERSDTLLNRTLGLPPWCGGVRSEYHAAARIVTASMLARASAGVR